MMIVYKKNTELKEEDLRELFLSVKWDSGNYPNKLKIALENSDTVITAWDGDKLVGLVNCLSDSIMTAYVHYVLVHESYQKQGIGKKMMEELLQVYKEYLRIVIISYSGAVQFYEKIGFEVAEEKIPMFITTLRT